MTYSTYLETVRNLDTLLELVRQYEASKEKHGSGNLSKAKLVTPVRREKVAVN